MGKPTGFLEYERQDSYCEPPLKRIQDFHEFHTPLPLEKTEAAGRPLHGLRRPLLPGGTDDRRDGQRLPPAESLPGVERSGLSGKLGGSYRRLAKTNCFPEFTSRVCPALCEAACTCNLNGEPVATKENERAIIEYAWEHGIVQPEPPKVRTGKKVAVVGSGPSGLAAAMQLNRRGHSVTVFERRDRVGGLLRYGIPNMKLEKSVLDRRIRLMEEEGITFVTNADVGREKDARELLRDFDRVLLCCEPPIPGIFRRREENCRGSISLWSS